MPEENTGGARLRYGSEELCARIHEDALVLLESMGVKASPAVAEKIRRVLDPGEARHLLWSPEAGRFYLSREAMDACLDRIRQSREYWPRGFGTGGMAAYITDSNGPRSPVMADMERLCRFVGETDELTCIQSSFNPGSRIKKDDIQKRAETECACIDLMIRHTRGKLVTPTIRTDEGIRYLAAYHQKGHKVGAALSIISTFLTISEEMADPFIRTVTAGVPILMNSMPIAGLTGPCSMSSLATLAHAEALFGMLLAQLIRPGIPSINAAMPTVADMTRKDMPLKFGSRSNTLLNILIAEVNCGIGLPACQSACSHSRDSFDKDAELESAATFSLINRFDYHILRHLFGFSSQLNDFSIDDMEKQVALYRRIRRNPLAVRNPEPAVYDPQGFEAIIEGIERGDFRSLDHTLKHVGRSFVD